MIARVVDHALAAIHREWRFCGNLFGNGHYLGEHGFLVIEDTVNKPRVFGLRGRHAAASVGKFADNALGNELHQARECAHVCGHANVDFLNADERVCGGITHVACGHHIHAAAHTSPLDCCNHGYARIFQNREALLKIACGVDEGGTVSNPFIFFLGRC